MVAVAPVPPPPVKVMVGALVYPLPAFVIVAEVTGPATVAVAVAPVPPSPVNVTVGAEV